MERRLTNNECVSLVSAHINLLLEKSNSIPYDKHHT